MYPKWFHDNKVKVAQKEQDFNTFVNGCVDFHKNATPVSLCCEIVDKLDQQGAFTKNSKVLVIANIEFVYVMNQYFTHHGYDINNLYFATPDHEKAEWIKLSGVHIILYNYDNLQKGFEGMKFDVCVGNPPYTTGTHGAANLYVKFVELAFSLSDIVAFITPSAPLKGSADGHADKFRAALSLAKFGLKWTKNTSGDFRVEDANIMTCAFISEHNYTGDVEVVTDSGKKVHIPQHTPVSYIDGVSSIISKMEMICSNNWWSDANKYYHFVGSKVVAADSMHAIVSHLSDKGYTIIEDMLTCTDIESWRVVNSYMRNSTPWLRASWVVPPGVVITSHGYKPHANYRQIVCNNETEAKNLAILLQSKLYCFLHESTYTSRSLDGPQTKMCPKLDLTHEWNDVDLYNYFRLDATDIAAVEGSSH